MDRRKFHKLSMAALGGLMAGAASGCSQRDDGAAVADKDAASSGTDATEGGTVLAESPLLNEPHVCRGLNTCRGKDRTGENACAGQGTCATVEPHECAGQNACKGQGGCGADPGENACKTKGGCAVPLMDSAWTRARGRFETLMRQQGQKVGAAPEPSA